MISKKKTAKKPPPGKVVKKKSAKPLHTTKPDKKEEKQMPEDITAQTTVPPTGDNYLLDRSIAVLTSIDSKLGELVQIETYLANKVASAPMAPIAPPVATPFNTQSIQPHRPPQRPGSGTIGGLVWDYCDGLNEQLSRPPTKGEVIAAVKQYSPTFNGQPINDLTVATQYSKWRSSQGLPKLARGFGANHTFSAPTSAVPTPSAPTIGAPPVQQSATAVSVAPSTPTFPNMPTSRIAVAPSMPALPVALPTQQAPLPAAAVPSVIAPTAVPTVSLPPWLKQAQ